MKNKKKRGFTLIELLAIIVILAIIAVITVPIILNIIENSKRGAAIDSAHGYKDGIDKFFVSKLSDNSDYNMPDGTYAVDNTTGYLVGTGDLESNSPLEVKISGSIPNSGTVELENNKVKNACLEFGDYKVTISNGKVGEAEAGTCAGGNSSTPSPSNTITASTLPNVVEEGQDGELRRIDHTNGTTDYRYMGHDPYNYIYFNCTDYDPEEQNSTNCEVWRIISIENNQFKIIRDALSTKMQWDNANFVNNWAGASLKTYLNGDFYNSLTAPTKEKISSSTWYLSGWGQGHSNMLGAADSDRNYNYTYEDYVGNGMFPEGAYIRERGTESYNDSYPTSTTANVGLIYPSDYGFASMGCYSMCAATDTTSCGSNFGTYNLSASTYVAYINPTQEIIPVKRYDDSVCTSSNWLYTNYEYWTISQYTDSEDYIFTIQTDGTIWGYGEGVYDENYVRPTLYLNSNIELEGTGSEADPFKIIN